MYISQFELSSNAAHWMRCMQLVHGKEEKGRKGALTAMLLSNLNQKLKSKIDFEVALGGS